MDTRQVIVKETSDLSIAKRYAAAIVELGGTVEIKLLGCWRDLSDGELVFFRGTAGLSATLNRKSVAYATYSRLAPVDAESIVQVKGTIGIL